MEHATRRILRLAAATTLVALASSSPAAEARPHGGQGTRHVTFDRSEPTVVGGDFNCDPTDPTRCAGTFRNLLTLTGDFAGTTYEVGTATLRPDGTYQGAAVVQFTGSVTGCGSGTLVIVEIGVLDPATGDSWGTWEITAGSGTGDLAQLSGSVAGDSRVDDAMAGTIRCD